MRQHKRRGRTRAFMQHEPPVRATHLGCFWLTVMLAVVFLLALSNLWRH